MSETLEQSVYFTELDDGTHLAASFQRPWFCVSGATLEEARDKAERALAFCESQPAPIRPARPTATLTPFRPTHIEKLRAAAC